MIGLMVQMLWEMWGVHEELSGLRVDVSEMKTKGAKGAVAIAVNSINWCIQSIDERMSESQSLQAKRKPTGHSFTVDDQSHF